MSYAVGHVPPPEALGAVLTPQSAAELLRTAPRAFAVHVGPTISWRPLSGLRQAADVISQFVEASPGPEAPTTRTTASLSVSSTSPTVDSPPADGLPVLPLEWTWVDVEASSPEDIVLLGRWIALPILTPKDLTQSVEKAEALARRGAVLCMVRSGPSTPTAPLPLHVVSLRNVVLTVHVGKHPAVWEVVRKLQGELVAEGGAPSQDPAAHSAFWVLCSLLTVSVECTVAGCTTILREAGEIDREVFETYIEEHDNMLRRITTAEATISALQSQMIAKQRLLGTLLSSTLHPFIPAASKVYLRDVAEAILLQHRRLNFGMQTLSRASTAYMAFEGLQDSKRAIVVNSTMRRSTFFTTLFIPFFITTGLFSMNIKLPMRDNTDLWGYVGIAVFWISFVTIGYLIYHFLDTRRIKRRVW